MGGLSTSLHAKNNHCFCGAAPRILFCTDPRHLANKELEVFAFAENAHVGG
jgi:hypothetical protein